MIWIILVVALFLLLLLFPLLLGTYWYYRNDDSVLDVKQDRRRDPRYFAHSFEALFLEAWPNRKNGTIALSKKEPYQLADEIGQDYAKVVKSLLVAEKRELCPPAKTRFLREIYSWQNAHFSEGSELRAVHTKENLILGSDVQINRWADAEGTIAVYDNCDLGMSLTSGTAITIGRNCTFRRIYAPVIHTGSYPGWSHTPEYERKEWIYSLKEINARKRIRHRVSKSDEGEDGIVHASFVTKGKAVIEEEVIVQGGVRSHKGIRLAERAVVCGDLFAEDDIYLCSHSTVLGSIFTQGNIYCEKDVVIGRKGRVSSLIARGEIVLEENCFIYGYISNESGGIVCPVSRQDEIPKEQRPGEEQYLIWPKPSDTLIFESAREFLLADVLGYRHNCVIRKVFLPEGVKEIPESMFFDCPLLEEVHLPSTLEKIGNYAFADCKKLDSVELASLKNLRYIGRNAFDGCLSLKEVVFPSGLEVIEDAAFFNCTSLEKATMAKGSRLRFVGIHSFQNCPLITEPIVAADLEEETPELRGAWGEENAGISSAEAIASAVAATAVTAAVFRQGTEEKTVSPAEEADEPLEELRRDLEKEKEKKQRKEKTRRRRRAARRRTLHRLAMAFLGILFLAALVGVYFLASVLAEREKQESLDAQEVVREVELYRNQGLLEGVELASVPEEITDEYIVFRDRVLARSSFTDSDIASSTEALRAFLESMNSRQPGVKAYVMTVPLRIAFEDSFSTDEAYLSLVKEEKEKMASMEGSLLSGISDLASPIPLMEILETHKEEYLFYRTSPSWTARGAYYGTQQFLEAAGLETFPLESFWEYGKNTTTGIFALSWNLLGYEDRQYYYLYENYNPLVELLGTEERDLMISMTRADTGAFVGNSHDAYKLDGLAKNGRAVMVIGENNGSVCVPWLVTEFERIVYVNMSFFSPEEFNLWQMLSEYGITDVLVVEDAQAVSDTRFQSVLRQLAGQ